MNQDDFKKFANALGTLAELHGKELSPMLMKLYFKALEQFSIQDVENAIMRAITELKFFPKPVELIEFITGKGGNIEDIALVEADNVINAMRRIGAYQSVIFDDPVTTAVIQQGFGGWVKMCQDSNENDNKWLRIEFVKIYRAYANQGIRSDEKLIGITEEQNIAKGYIEHVPCPVLIGQKRKEISGPKAKEVEYVEN